MKTDKRKFHTLTDEEKQKTFEHAKKEREKSMKDSVTNGEFAKSNELFRQTCDKVSIKPTSRQASRFRNKHGKAYTAHFLQGK